MGDYKLAGLSHREFEHLIQSLSLKLISTGVTIFGDGPDGGREATCQGATGYKRKHEWNGYLVVQAKFQQKPTYDSKADGDWAIEHLRDELQQYTVENSRRRKPEYYLFATNANLTSVQDLGSKDKAFAVLEEHAQVLGLKDFDIWDYDKICRFLDGDEDIRKRYMHFIAAGDVLSDMMTLLPGMRRDFEAVMGRFLQNEFLAEQHARLTQAGSLGQQQTQLARVFIDLPTSLETASDPPDEKPDSKGRLPTGFLGELIEIGYRRLDRRSVAHDRKLHSEDDPSNGRPERGRFVLVGGPGQGKSTLAQFACQLYRAAILDTRDRAHLAPGVDDALKSVKDQCIVDGLALPTARRFPVHVVLTSFADELADGVVGTLMEFIARRIGKRADDEIAVSDLRSWLSSYPWVLVFDGLDEVPSSSNRAGVLEQIERFWVECAECEADVLVVATTRPQGYSKEFSPLYYSHRYLAPLSTKRAMHYAERLASARFGPDVDGKERALKLLSTACRDDATARLMRSPLQVTIMHTLVEQGGEPPRERWRLFNKYYAVIYDREKQKGTQTSQLLIQHSEHIDYVHRDVGLRLQISSEGAGSTEALIPADDLRSMIENRLRDREFEEEETTEIANQIQIAALDRLVFLAPAREDRLGFEIRSLQEYMAACSIMTGKETEVNDRLNAIAPISHWRNVFQFAAGKCFTESEHLSVTDHFKTNHQRSNQNQPVISLSL